MDMHHVISNLPIWQIMLFFSLALFAVMTCVALVTHSAVSRMKPVKNTNLIGLIGSQIGIQYAVIIGFVVIAVWQGFTKADGIVKNEANSLGDIWKNVRAFPPKSKELIHDNVEQYLQIVINEEWPLQRKGLTSNTARQALIVLRHSVLDFKPNNITEQEATHELIKKLNEVIEARQMRLYMVNEGIATAIWMMIIIDTLVILVYLGFLLGIEFALPNFILSFLVSLLFGVTLSLIASLEYPFIGDFSISSKPLQMVLDNISQRNIEQIGRKFTH